MEKCSIICDEKIFDEVKSDIVFIFNVSKNFFEKIIESAKNFGSLVVCVTSNTIEKNNFDSVVLTFDVKSFIEKISNLIENPYEINLDFISIKRFFKNAGNISTGFGKSEDELTTATEYAISSFEQKNIFNNAKEILMIVSTSSKNFSFAEVNKASIIVQENFSENANMISGVVNDEKLDNFVEVLILVGEGRKIYELDWRKNFFRRGF